MSIAGSGTEGAPGRRLSLAVLAIAVWAAAVAGCAAPAPRRLPSPSSTPAPARQAAPPRVAPAPDWESFARTRAALAGEIDTRARALRSGAAGNAAAELASRRMTVSAWNLLDEGALESSQELLERAVSLDGDNGYAYLFLAYVHHVRGGAVRARELVSAARGRLPARAAFAGEVEGLARSVGAAAGS